MDINLAVGVIAFLGFFFSIIVHECAHALVAEWRGDDTARRLGRITLDPIPHIDPFMSLILPLILYFTGGPIFGGAKPVPINILRLRNPKKDMMLVAAAGPLSNILLAIVCALLLNVVGHIPGSFGSLLTQGVVMIVHVNLLLAAFNMIPIPPLDGSKVLAAFLPDNMAAQFYALERYGFFILFALLMMGALRGPIGLLYTFGLKLVGLFVF